MNPLLTQPTLVARHAAISLIGMIDDLWLGLALRNGQYTPDLAYRMCREHIKTQLNLSVDDPILAQPLDIEKRTSLAD